MRAQGGGAEAQLVTGPGELDGMSLAAAVDCEGLMWTRTEALAETTQGGVTEIVAGNKSRYAWSGPDDPEVKAILRAVKGGEVEAGKKEALDKLKEQKAAKAAAKGDAPAKKGKKTPPPADDDDELEEIEDDDDE